VFSVHTVLGKSNVWCACLLVGSICSISVVLCRFTEVLRQCVPRNLPCSGVGNYFYRLSPIDAFYHFTNAVVSRIPLHSFHDRYL